MRDPHWDISASSFCHQTATNEAREKYLITDMESLEFEKFYDVCLTSFKNKQILCNKTNHIYLATTKTIYRLKDPIGVTFLKLT